jgi:hypothetical protein
MASHAGCVRLSGTWDFISGHLAAGTFSLALRTLLATPPTFSSENLIGCWPQFN